AGNRDHAGRSGLPIDGGQLAEELAGLDVAEDHDPASIGADERAHDTADDEEDVGPTFAVAEDLLLGVVAPPQALRVEAADILVAQRAEERYKPQRLGLSRHSCGLPPSAWRKPQRLPLLVEMPGDLLADRIGPLLEQDRQFTHISKRPLALLKDAGVPSLH